MSLQQVLIHSPLHKTLNTLSTSFLKTAARVNPSSYNRVDCLTRKTYITTLTPSEWTTTDYHSRKNRSIKRYSSSTPSDPTHHQVAERPTPIDSQLKIGRRPDQVIGRSGKVYSRRTVKIVETIGRLLGYSAQKSTAVTLTSSYYDRCAARFDIEKKFWLEECGLPDSFQTWFQVTQLHMWLITVRFRAMKSPLGKYYIQEFVNHSFLDTEERIRGPKNKITQGTLIKKYMKILLHQHRGLQTVLDWAISRDPGEDQVDHSTQFLANAIWRNLFGASWGRGMGGVKGIFESDEKTPPPQPSSLNEQEDDQAQHSLENDVKFAENLERLVIFIRKELVRLDQVSDRTIVTGQSPDGQGGLTQFGKI